MFIKQESGKMNWMVLKDSKVILAFVLAFVLEIIGIVLASTNDSSWVIFVMAGILLTFYAVYRASQLTK